MYISVIAIITISLVFLYQRHIPVLGIGKIDGSYVSYAKEDVTIVDVRDYQTSCREAINHVYCMPLPYLKRHFRNIPTQNVIVIVSDHIEKNSSIRLLRKKGMRVIGYYPAKDLEKELYDYGIRRTAKK